MLIFEFLMESIWLRFLEGMRYTTLLEYVAVFAGIASVWFSKKEHILVYPVGLVNTVIYVYISVKAHLFGEASVNIFYTVMSIYGWINWARVNDQKEHVVHITYSSKKDWLLQWLFFAFCFIVIYFALQYSKQNFAKEAIPLPDAFAAATAFTGMLLMTRKKVESWYWWIATNIASIPLYFVKDLVFTSVYYLVLLILAFYGLKEWKQKASQPNLSKL